MEPNDTVNITDHLQRMDKYSQSLLLKVEAPAEYDT